MEHVCGVTEEEEAGRKEAEPRKAEEEAGKERLG
jgi:hypothetical protein